MINPEYAENIIVGITNNNQFNWYILNKLLCLLDLTYLKPEEYNLYMQNNLYYSLRKNFITIDKNNISQFLTNITNNMISPEHLQLMLLKNIKEYNDLFIEDFFPVLYLNFDKKIAYSQYPEYIDFESFLPDKWIFMYDDFSYLLDNADKYWIYKEKNIFDEAVKKFNSFGNKN